MDNRPVSSPLRSENKHLRIGIGPVFSNPASMASPTMDVLRNLDLLDLIFSYLATLNKEYSIDRSDRPMLLRMALTCKAFFEPAMHLLWYEMHSFLPLLLVMPSVVKKSGTYTSTSIVQKTDLSRFEFYASRIRVLRLSTFKEIVSTHIYMAITEAFQGKSLFPALTTVHISSLDYIANENFLLLHLIAPSPISTLEIRYVKKSNEVRLNSFLNDISRLHRSGSTNLHPLSVLSLEGSFLPSTTNLLPNFTRLAKLAFEILVVTTNFLKDVLEISSSLLSLQELELELTRDEPDVLQTNLSQESKLYTFSTLQHLNVAGPSALVCDILRSIYGACLSRITFTIFRPAIVANAISRCVQRCVIMTPTLLDLHITLPSHTVVLDDDIFAPFQSYRLLRSLHISSPPLIRPYFVDLFDKEFGEWPILESATLKLETGQNILACDMHQTASIHLPATSCPKLRKLEVYLPNPFSANVQVANDALQDLLDSSPRTDHNLTELKLTFLEPSIERPSIDTFMEAKEAILFARVIDHLYPNLKCLDIYGDTSMRRLRGSAWRPWYRGIETMVKNFREVRGGYRANIHPT